jgi:hypothetical protein
MALDCGLGNWFVQLGGANRGRQRSEVSIVTPQDRPPLYQPSLGLQWPWLHAIDLHLLWDRATRVSIQPRFNIGLYKAGSAPPDHARALPRKMGVAFYMRSSSLF